MKKNQQYYVLKLNTSYLKKHKYKIDVLFNEAVSLNQIVSVGDSAVLREIRRLTNHNIDLEQIDEWFNLRKKIKQRQKSKENAKLIGELTQKINDALYIPEYVSIVVDNTSHYEYINQNSLIINNNQVELDITLLFLLTKNFMNLLINLLQIVHMILNYHQLNIMLIMHYVHLPLYLFLG